MRKFNLKSAFTIAEMIVVLIIIGIVIAISIHSIKQKQQTQYQKLYETAHNALIQAVAEARSSFKPPANLCRRIGNTINFSTFYGTRECWDLYTDPDIVFTLAVGDFSTYDQWVEQGSQSITQTYEEWDGGGHDSVPGYPRAFPGFLFGSHNIGSLSGAGTDTEFCNSLVKNINTLSASNQCKSFLYSRSSGVNWNQGDDFDKVFCASKYEGTPPTGRYVCDEEGGKINPSFIAANGQQFYISPIVFANPPFYPPQVSEDADAAAMNVAQEIAAEEQHKRIPFRFVAVDLNGSSGPNTQLKIGNRLPDIVLFAITADGNVIPLGVPEFDLSYLEAKVVYPKCIPGTPASPNAYCGNNKVSNDKDRSENMTLFDAKMNAWFGELHSGDWLNSYYGQVFMPSQALSYSNLLYYWGINCKGTGCSDQSGMGNTYYADPLLANIVFQFIWANEDKGADYANHTIVPLVLEGGTLNTKMGCVYGRSPSFCPTDKNKRAKNFCCILLNK